MIGEWSWWDQISLVIICHYLSSLLDTASIDNIHEQVRTKMSARENSIARKRFHSPSDSNALY
jgi:hypothetical protein